MTKELSVIVVDLEQEVELNYQRVEELTQLLKTRIRLTEFILLNVGAFVWRYGSIVNNVI